MKQLKDFGFMETSYKKLWKILIDHDMTRTELRTRAKLSSVSLTKLGKGENVGMGVLIRICEVLNCNVGDIVDVFPNGSEKNARNS